MSGLLETAGGWVTRRRLLSTWLPILLFTSALATVGVAAIGIPQEEAWWERLPGQAQVFAGLVFVAATVLASEFLAGIRPTIVGLYEGNWTALPGGKAFMRSGKNRTRTAADRGRPWTSPTPERQMPTRLGNILAAAAQQADRYGMDAVTVWPRLYAVLPERFTIVLGQAATSLEFMITISALSGAFALIACPVAAVCLPWYGAPLLLWLSGVLAWAGYRGALLAAGRYGELVRAAFDVHRWLLLDAMGLERPQSWAGELKQWQQIHQLWQRGRPDSGSAHLLGYPSSPVQPPSPDPPLLSSTSPSTDETSSFQNHSPGGESDPPTNDTSSAGRRPLLIALGFGVLVTVSAALFPTFRDDGVRAARDLPDFYVLDAADLTRPAHQLVGRYTLKPIRKHAEVSPNDLGPVLPAPGLAGTAITSLRVQRPEFDLNRGDVLTVSPLRNPGPAVRVKVLDFSASQDSLILAVPAADISRFLATDATPLRIAR